jgi:HTH-type transcriptional regulator, osmoprotectant uptake regulator
MPKASDRKPDARRAAAPTERATQGDRSDRVAPPDDRVSAARAAVLDGVGREIAASFPGITRLGGQIVAALYLADRPLSMDELSDELGRSKSNIFANLRGLEGAGIATRHRASGTRHDTFALRGKYPDVVVGAYLTRLRRVVLDKVSLCNHALGLLGDADGPEADALRDKLSTLLRKYERFAAVFAEIIPVAEGPVDLEDLIDNIPSTMMGVFSSMARKALGLAPRSTPKRQ